MILKMKKCAIHTLYKIKASSKGGDLLVYIMEKHPCTLDLKICSIIVKSDSKHIENIRKSGLQHVNSGISHWEAVGLDYGFVLSFGVKGIVCWRGSRKDGIWGWGGKGADPDDILDFRVSFPGAPVGAEWRGDELPAAWGHSCCCLIGDVPKSALYVFFF